MSGSVDIRLSGDEALVLLEMLTRWFERSPQAAPATAFTHDAERAVLEVVLTPQVEKQVAASFADNYTILVGEARERICMRYPPFEN